MNDMKTFRCIPRNDSVALLTITVFACCTWFFRSEAAECSPPATGLVSWWRAEGTLADETGGNTGVLNGGVIFGAGKAGSAFALDGSGAAVSLGNPANLRLQDFTIEAWVKRADLTIVSHGSFGNGVLFGYGGGGYGLYLDPSGRPFLSKIGSSEVAMSGTITDLSFHHLAVTKSGSTIVFYLDGVAYPAAGYNPGFTFSTEVAIGARGDNLDNSFLGSIDEMAVYNRALLALEVQLIYGAGSSGKCAWPTPPAIVSQPVNQTTTTGDATAFGVIAAGTAPLSYQWWHGGGPVPSGTGAVLTLTNTQPGDAGDYFVVVTNLLGSVTSSNATLMVNAVPPCTAPPGGLISWWRAETNGADAISTNNGTLAGNASFSTGKVGTSFIFDGNGDAIRLGNPANLRLQDFTIEAWIKRTSATIVSYGSYGIGVLFGYGTGGYGLYLDPNGYPRLSKIGYNEVQPTATISDTNYHHLAVTKSGNSVVFFIDGVAYPVGAYNPGFAFSTSLAIGAKGDNLDNSFLGAIDELAVYNRALSTNEVQAIFHAGSAGKCRETYPPYIVTQPASQTVVAGDSAVFSIVAGGTPPLSYQWSINGTNLLNATSSSLALTNIQADQAGTYSVTVTNRAGTTNSSGALLMVNPLPPCATPAAGLIGWWQAENNTLDFLGSNSGAPAGNTSYGPGRQGAAFVFDGRGDAVRLGNPANLQLQNLTIEGWIKRASPSIVSYGAYGNGMLLGYGTGGYGLYLNSSGYPYLSKVGVNEVAAAVSVNDTAYHHLAVTKNGPAVVFYLDGVAYPAAAYDPGFVFTTDLAIGAKGDTLDNSFLGAIDELAVYDHALTTNEVQAIYAASGAGKCTVPIPPFLTLQPTPQTATAGGNATFTIVAAGTQPLSYQWRFNGTNLSGATAASLTLTNLQFSQSGNYSAVVTNLGGATNSNDAWLTVTFPPATVRVLSTNSVSGRSVTVPVQFLANGDENALGFSLNFDPQLLTYASVLLGESTSSGSLLLNTNQAAAGKLGIGVGLPANASFLAGTQEVVRITFTSPVLQGNTAVVTAITFGDTPTGRQLANAQALPLAASYLDGSMTLTPSDLEGDVAPRSTGDRTNSITDWVQVGRFAAGLDIPTAGGEFQRADCAPRFTLGNGSINVTDWVQAGRYAAGLDPRTAAGGPTSEGGASITIHNAPKPFGIGPGRKVRVADVPGIQGLAVTLPVLLESHGDENALGFSVSYDPAKFAYTGTVLGAGATGAVLNVNTSQLASGKVGVALALPIGNSFAAGVRELARINLLPTSTAIGSIPVTFSNYPISCVVSDPLANELTAQYVTGSITVNPLPTLLIAPAGENVTLTWPEWAATFSLQAEEGAVAGNWTNVVAPLQTNNGNIILSVPVAGQTKYFRLHTP